LRRREWYVCAVDLPVNDEAEAARPPLTAHCTTVTDQRATTSDSTTTCIIATWLWTLIVDSLSNMRGGSCS
jgi:hypothetical protein